MNLHSRFTAQYLAQGEIELTDDLQSVGSVLMVQPFRLVGTTPLKQKILCTAVGSVTSIGLSSCLQPLLQSIQLPGVNLVSLRVCYLSDLGSSLESSLPATTGGCSPGNYPQLPFVIRIGWYNNDYVKGLNEWKDYNCESEAYVCSVKLCFTVGFE